MKRLIILALLTVLSISAHAQKQGSFLFDLGIGVGPKHGLGCTAGVHYFVRDGWSIDGYGTLSMGGLALGIETSYFPEFADSWLYVDAGMSMLIGGQVNGRPMVVVCLNGDFGWNFGRWDGETDTGIATTNAVYGELGVSRILFNSKQNELSVSRLKEIGAGIWWFPNVEIGIRTNHW